jgi:hypothetical protein
MKSSQERSIAKSKLAEGPNFSTLRDPDPVMPKLDKNGLMAGSAERCERTGQAAAWLSNAAWRCMCESGREASKYRRAGADGNNR